VKESLWDTAPRNAKSIRMPTFEYVCERHGPFEIFFEKRYDIYPCPVCSGPSEQYYLTPPAIDSFAAGLWNIDDPQLQRSYIKDKKTYHSLLTEKGLRVKERGSDKEAENVLKENKRKGEEKLREGVGKWFQERTLDQVRSMIKVDAQIHEAQMKGDINTTRRLGVPTSLSEAYEKANKEQS